MQSTSEATAAPIQASLDTSAEPAAAAEVTPQNPASQQDEPAASPDAPEPAAEPTEPVVNGVVHDEDQPDQPAAADDPTSAVAQAEAVAEVTQPAAEAEAVAETTQLAAEAETVAETTQLAAEAETVAETTQPAAEAEAVTETTQLAAEAETVAEIAQPEEQPAAEAETVAEIAQPEEQPAAEAEAVAETTQPAAEAETVAEIEQSEEQPAAEAETVAEIAQPEEQPAAEAETVAEIAQPEEQPAAEAETVAEIAQPEEQLTEQAVGQPVAAIEQPAALVEHAAVAVQPEEQLTEQAVGQPAEQAPEASGASFTPVEQKEVRPRRLKDLEVGMELDGRVTSIALYGVFVDVGVGRDGLVHISEMSDTRINSPSDLVQIGDSVRVRIKSLDLDARRISLTMRTKRDGGGDEERRGGRSKRPEVNREMLSNLRVGEMVDGTITGLSSFGAFVDIGVGKDGLVHISELAEGRVDKPEDAVQVGETYSFKLLEVDPEGSRISLSLRRAQRIQKMRELEPGQELEGTVSGMATFGAFVDIGVGRDGLVHISQLREERVNKVEDVVKVGETVQVRVLEVDPQSKRISLTMRLNEEDPTASDELDDGPDQPVSQAPAQASAPTQAPAQASAPAQGHTPSQGATRDEGRRREGRENREGREGRRRGRGQGEQQSQIPGGVYSSGDEDTDAEFTGNATLEDLVSKFGGSQRRDRRRRTEGEGEGEEEEDRGSQRQRQRDAIRRTLRRSDEETT